MDPVVQIIITVIGVLGSASIWKFLEARLKDKSADEKDELRNFVLELTAEVNSLRVKVEFLETENQRLKNV